jgi:single-strand DNA-binding protein
MATDMNSTVISGRLVSDATVKSVGKQQVANFRLASTRSFKKDNEWQEVPTFIDCEAWGTLAERVGKLSKGTRILVRAQLNQDEWDDKNGGGKRSKHKLSIFELHNLTGKPQTGEAATGEQASDDLPF